jgi:hypothetical protein
MHKQALDIHGEYEYRTANPTRTALENALAVSRMAQEDWPFHLG